MIFLLLDKEYKKFLHDEIYSQLDANEIEAYEASPEGRRKGFRVIPTAKPQPSKLPTPKPSEARIKELEGEGIGEVGAEDVFEDHLDILDIKSRPERYKEIERRFPGIKHT